MFLFRSSLNFNPQNDSAMSLPPLSDFRSVHIIGCCGAGCAPLARILLEKGFRVTGSDLLDNAAAATLRRHGAQIAPAGHRVENLPTENDGLLVVRTSAAGPENPEVAEAMRRGLPVLRRGEALAVVADSYRRPVAVSGSAAEMSLDGMQAASLKLDVYSGGIVLRNAKIGSIAGTLSYGEFTLDACTTDDIELAGEGTEVSVTGTTVTNAAAFNGSGDTMTVKDSTFGALTINGKEDYSTDLQMNGVTVTGDVYLQAPYGTHEISNSTFGTLTCKSDSSELDLANVTVSGAVQIEQNYSDIEMENCTLNGLTAKMGDGDFEFKGALTGATAITIDNGDVDLAITGKEADYIYALNSEFGEVLVNGKPYKATVDKGTGANTIQVDVESGDIELNFL